MMNTLHKSLTIAFLAVSILISGLTIDFVGAQNTAVGPVVSRRPADLLRSRYIRFDRLNSRDGLSNDQIRGAAQDSYGFIWIGTLNGLNRYDGASVKVYRHDPHNPHSLSNNVARDLLVDRSGTPWIGTWGGGLNQYDRENDAFIHYQHDPNNSRSLSNNITRTIFEDRSGAIWVGTMGGLNKLDRESRTFTRYLHDPENPNSLSNNIVLAVVEDSAGVFWIGTEGGLNRFDPKTEQFTIYRHDPDDSASLSHNVVRVICEDHTGNLWVGTNKGLCKFNPEIDGFTNYQHDPADPLSLSNNYVTWVFEDREGRLWVCTWGGGLNRFDLKTATFTRYRHHPADPYSLSNNNVNLISEDRHGMLWIATDAGVNRVDGKAKPFYHYRVIADNPNGLGENAVRAIHAGRSGSVWVGTNGGGFFRFDRQTEKFTGYQHDPADPNSLSADTAVAIYEDRMGLIWVGTSGHGLNRFDPDSKRYTHYRYDAANPRSLSSDIIHYIYEDRAGTLWFGTSKGLNAYDRETEQYTRYQHDPADPQTLSNDYVTCITEDHESKLWVSTFGGLNRLDRETGTFTRYHHLPGDPHSLAQDGVLSIYEDRKGALWIGTAAGLEKFDRTNGQFTHYTTANGLPSNSIYGILEDEQGRLWLSTSSKMSRFDPRTETFRNYDVSDGLQSNTFYRWSAYSKSLSGEMYFGGANGFNAFYPDQIVDDTTPPSVLITDFQLANKPVPIGADSVLQKSILETDHLSLSYLDRVFSFEFAVLNYRAPEQNRYRYKMDGFEKEWNEVDRTRRFATYTNLDSGDYVFKVIGSNNDGVWNEEGKSIKITILPPWWETTWFLIGLGMLAIGLLVSGYRWRVSSVEARSRELEAEVAERTQALQAANQAKSLFLANMSHELRTPLNAILGFSRMLAREQNATAYQQEKLAIINRSGQHLLSMINDVLDLSKIEAGSIERKEHPFDLVALIKEISVMIQSRAAGKRLSVVVEVETLSFPYVKTDVGKLRQILINLLSNAVMFTDEGGVTIRCGNDPISEAPNRCHIVIEVEDTGPGIDSAIQAQIFEPFVQGVDVPARKGTGLGLSICKRYADFMGGTIELESEVGKGSIFRLRLPAEIAEASDVKTSVDHKPRVIGLAPTQKTWRVLVADDNPENLLLLKSLLEAVGFVVLEARNGQEALEAFKKQSPDFIWMDMRMPVMDGYEATRRIRKWEAAIRGQKTEDRSQITEVREQREEGEKLGSWEGENKSEIPPGRRPLLPLRAGGQNPKSKMEGIPIIAITASAIKEQRPDIVAAGCDDMVIKPFRSHEIFEAMGRFLDIEYIYAPKEEAAPDRLGKTDLTSAKLADLPAELLQELREATISLNSEAITAVIERIEPLAPDTAKGLRTLLDDLQMGRLQELIEKTG